ncbi:unnamed protein product [Pieris macdunnoughi]|uniref:Uncharacterized protein n=1 Tax=Pieris macdunnoughi TaxID=345717 RepID=A0A821X769_9NEOP|nr:unnamed protein product [Pieris macdunnoughi]
MKKWKNIRDSYMKEVKSETTSVSGQSAPKKKRYIYFDLSFLRPTVSTVNERESNVSPILSTLSQNQEEDNLMRPPRQNQVPPKKKKQTESTQIPQITKILNESLQLQKLNNDSDAKGNRAFLMSFVPIIDSMTPDLAMETRYEITNLSEIYKETKETAVFLATYLNFFNRGTRIHLGALALEHIM